MYKAIILFFSISFAFFAKAQETEKKTPVTSKQIMNATDSITKAVAIKQDTTKKESRRERRKREKAEEEAKIPKIFKDSTRLAIEAKTTASWKKSMMVPGWGQYSNGGLWWIKVPVIYGGFASTVLIFDFNNRYYKELITELAYRADNNGAKENPNYQFASDQSIINAKDYARRNRDMMVLLTVGWYGLNIVEAYVGSMLKYRWDVGTEKLSYSIRPTLMNMPQNNLAFHTMPTMGLKLSLQIK